MGRQGLEHRRHRHHQARREGVGLDARQGVGEAAYGTDLRRVGGVSALAGGGQDQGQVALFGDVYHRHGLAGQQGIVGHQHAALVHHPGEVQSQFPHARGQGTGAVMAADFLVVAEREDDTAARLETLRQQLLRGLQQAQHPHLVVQGTAAVNAAVGHHSGEGRVLPVPLRAGLHRHHIRMGREQYRRQRGITAGPAQQQAETVDGFHFQGVENQGVIVAQELVEVGKLAVIDQLAVLVADGRYAHRLRQSLGG